MISHVRSGLVLLALLLSSGCAEPPPPEGAVVDGDPELYATQVHPIVARRCAFLGCHGREGMPLTFYAVGLLRWRDPNGGLTELVENQLSEAELEYDRRALVSRAGPQDPGGNLLIERMLPVEAGGIPHGGVVVYQHRTDPELEVLRQFLRTAHAP
jgi:hypothetical protein